MRVKYTYCERYNDKLIQILNEKAIKYSVVGDGLLVNKMIKFSVYDSTETMREVFKYTKSKPVITNEYAKSELMDAELLCIEPSENKITIFNPDEAYQLTCCYKNVFGIEKACHKKQISLFQIQKVPSSKTGTAFYASDTGRSELFVDKRIYDLVQGNALKDVDFLPVKKCDGSFTNEFFQMTTKQFISAQNVIVGADEKTIRCPICGQQKIVTDSHYQLRLSRNGCEMSSDLYMTESIFGEGLSYPYYLISQRFYQLLLKNKLLKNVKISPVVFL